MSLSVKYQEVVEKKSYKCNRVQLGKKMVFLGFFISVIGVIAYCAGSFSVVLVKETGGVLYDNPGWLIVPTLATIGLGTLIWFLGLIIHLRGVMDEDE